MKKVILSSLSALILSVAAYPQQIIADHTVVSKYNTIPQYYLDKVKKMWVSIAGESHSQGYRTGCELLEALDSRFQVNVTESGTPEAYTADHMRISRATWGDNSHSTGWIYSYGEEDWWTNATARSRTKAGITYSYHHSRPISVFGFGWCWDAYAGSASSGTDPVTGNHWYGWSEGSSSGDKPWGINDDDNSASGNSVNMDDYLTATQEYIDYCADSIPTVVIFTTGPVDSYYSTYTAEALYQAHLKYERIREYVRADSKRILFDFADILCYDNNGTLETGTWSGKTFPTIAYNNENPTISSYHISEEGALRLAKALWWMLARIAGWDGVSTSFVPVTSITLSSQGGATTISTANGTLQINAAILPSNATNKTVTWSVTKGTGDATISQTGLLTAKTNGTVTAVATANDGSGVTGTFIVTISNQSTGVEEISNQPAITVLSDKGSVIVRVNDLAVSGDVFLYNTGGQLLEKKHLNGFEIVFEKPSLPSGLYIIVFKSDHLSESHKIIIR